MLKLCRTSFTALAIMSIGAVGYYLAYPCERAIVNETVSKGITGSKSITIKPAEEQVRMFNLMEENSFRSDLTAECTLEYANAKKLPQDHPCLVNLIRKSLKKPTPRNVPYNLKSRGKTLMELSAGQVQAVVRILNNQTNGFYLECGGADGESFSNSLYLEAHLNWTGLLVEPNPKYFDTMANKVNRKSWKLNSCLSTENYPTEVAFDNVEVMGKAQGGKVDEDTLKEGKLVNVQCFPLYSVLLALGRTEIDYLSLDVEGQEFDILKTVPWDKVDIKVLTVEWEWVKEGQRSMIEFMENNGYVHFGNIATDGARDSVFVKDFLSDLRPDYEFYYRDGELPN